MHMRDPSQTIPLQGRRLLLVEDDYLIADELQKDLAVAGAEVVGPVPSVAEALDLIASEALDGAVLDVNLGGESAYPVADALRACGVPFVFTTGYDYATILPAYSSVPCCEKPAGARKVAQALGLK
jgi:ActR/RegA family two-component response regulator